MSAPTGIRRLYAVLADIDAVHPGGHPEHTHYHGARTECPACLIDTIRAALDEYGSEPFDLDELEPPCTCSADNWAGRIEDLATGRRMSVCTCAAHAVATQGYVQLITGEPASGLIEFDERAGV